MNSGIAEPSRAYAQPPLGLLGSPSPVPTINHYGHDADAQRYIEAVERADGAPLEVFVRTAINDFVVGCKIDGLWPAFRSCCILSGARTLVGALTPLVGPAPTNVNFVSADYSRRRGPLGNGSTKYLNTNVSASTIPRDNEHCAVWKSTGANNHDAMICVGNNLNASGVTAIRTFIGFCSQNSSFLSSANSAPGYLEAGFIGISRRDRRTVQYVTQTNYGEASNYASQGTRTDNWVVYQGWNGTTPWALCNFPQAFYSIGTYLNMHLLASRVRTLISTWQALPA